MKYTNQMIAGFLSLGLAACIHAKAPLTNIPLEWRPTSQVTLAGGNLNDILSTKIRFEEFKDVRKQPELIAENREDAEPKPVTTRDNVGKFVTEHIREAFDRAGLTTVDSGADVVISGEIRQLFVEETTTYKGDLLLRLKVSSRSGETLWTGTASGSAKRFGHSYSAGNYYEVISDSVLSAVSTLLQEPDFQKALAHK